VKSTVGVNWLWYVWKIGRTLGYAGDQSFWLLKTMNLFNKIWNKLRNLHRVDCLG